MIISSSLQTLPLEFVTAGVNYMLVITNAPGASTLVFKHDTNPDTISHPAHTAVTATTVVKSFLCPSPIMALVFSDVPTEPYFVTVVPLTFPEF